MTIEQLPNPTEITRDFCQPITFIPGGDGLLLDRRVMLSTRYNPRNATTMLDVIVNRSVPIVSQKRLDQGFTFRGGYDYLGGHPTKVPIRLNKGNRGTIYIGSEYEITFTNLGSRSTAAEIKSTQPLQIERINPHLPLRNFLPFKGKS